MPNVYQLDASKTFNSVGAYSLVAVLKLRGDRRSALLHILNSGANPFLGMKLTRGAVPGAHDDPSGSPAGTGEIFDWKVDADLNTATAEIPEVLTGTATPNIHTLAAGGKGHIRLASLLGVPEVGVWVKANTTVRVVGNAG